MSVKKSNKNHISRAVTFLKNRYAPRGARISFSQAGEDVLMESALKKMGVHQPLYIDIGAHHPVFGNNTYLFYTKGFSGVIIEPDQSLCSLSQSKRKRDTSVCAGAAGKDSEAKLFIFPQSTRNTFSETQAKAWAKESGQIMQESRVPVFSLDTIIKKFCGNKTPDVVSIDAEGYDLDILSNFSWNKRPKVFCVETAENTDLVTKRNQAIYDIFQKHQYVRYAETPANTIFIDTMK